MVRQIRFSRISVSTCIVGRVSPGLWPAVRVGSFRGVLREVRAERTIPAVVLGSTGEARFPLLSSPQGGEAPSAIQSGSCRIGPIPVWKGIH